MTVNMVGTMSYERCWWGFYWLRQETGRVGVGLHVAVHGGCPLLHLKRMTGPDDVNLRMVEYIPSGVC